MKIIKDGDLNRLKETKQFNCGACGCVFEADKGEYTAEEQYNAVDYLCECPCCGKQATVMKNNWANQLR